MIASIQIEGLKSFVDCSYVPCSDFTLISGANSAGKSTILQTLLILKQTCEAMPADGSLRLNGHLVHLGTGNIITKNGASIHIEFEDRFLEIVVCNEGGKVIINRVSLSKRQPVEQKQSILNISIASKIFAEDYKKRNRKYILARFHKEANLTPADASTQYHKFVADYLSVDIENNSISGLSTKTKNDDPWSVVRSNSTEEKLLMFCQRNRLVGDLYVLEDEWIVFRGISPECGIRRVEGISTEQRRSINNEVKMYLLNYLEDLVKNDIESRGSRDRELARRVTENFAQHDLINGVRILREIPSVASEIGDYGVPISDVLKNQLDDKLAELVSSVGRLLDLAELEDYIIRYFRKLENSAFENYNIPDEDNYLKDIVRFLTYDVLYLGPLREEPQLIYEDIVISSVSEIGSNGSNLIPYLFYKGDEHIEACLPIEFDSIQLEEIIRTDMSLLDAMNHWIRYLGIGYKIDIEQEQPYGLTAKLKTEEGGAGLLLTNVGVGVSQILPVLALGLSARPGQVVMYEQPELHLHPAVQTALADFLLSLVLTGIQVIVETHSEHLINRARLYVALGLIDPEKMSIVFCIRDEFGSSVESIAIDKSGYLEDWPEGFFDETEKVLLQIMTKHEEKDSL